MGWNTTVVVMNDALGEIGKDPEFGARLKQAIMRDEFPATVPARDGEGSGHANAATVIETHHADYDVLVRVGGNRGEVVRDAEQGLQVGELSWRGVGQTVYKTPSRSRAGAHHRAAVFGKTMTLEQWRMVRDAVACAVDIGRLEDDGSGSGQELANALSDFFPDSMPTSDCNSEAIASQTKLETASEDGA